MLTLDPTRLVNMYKHVLCSMTFDQPFIFILIVIQNGLEILDMSGCVLPKMCI